MAGEFLRSHGIDIDAEMDRIQTYGTDPTSREAHLANVPKDKDFRSPTMDSTTTNPSDRRISLISNVSLPKTEAGSIWDVAIHKGIVTDIRPHDPSHVTAERSNCISGAGALLAPSLCHPHVHIDKAYLLSHPKYAHLQIQKGDFAEAMELTGKAKAEFEEFDLLERGQRLIDESVEAGVTHMRAFVEVDAGVGMKCLDAGIELKKRVEREGRMRVQVCAFAQLPLFGGGKGDEEGEVVRGLMEEAAGRLEVEVLGSTPYVEVERERMERNVGWMVELAVRCGKHLDFHLDYNLDPETEPLVWFVIKTLKEANWSERNKGKKIVLGHCTRLTLFKNPDWDRVRASIGDLPISFVGLPTSDLFMMRTESKTRGTLDIPHLIKNYGLNACIGINNIGNAFTPHGSCDPLTLACNGVGIYQAGTKEDAEVLYGCVSWRAREAIGLCEGEGGKSVEVLKDDCVDIVLFGREREGWRTRRSVSEAVYLYDHCRGRRGIMGGRLTGEE